MRSFSRPCPVRLSLLSDFTIDPGSRSSPCQTARRHLIPWEGVLEEVDSPPANPQTSARCLSPTGCCFVPEFITPGNESILTRLSPPGGRPSCRGSLFARDGTIPPKASSGPHRVCRQNEHRCRRAPESQLAITRQPFPAFPCAHSTITRAVSSASIAVLSTTTASSARTSGDILRSRSRRSRWRTSAST
jgi:hypothetical protein